MHQRWFIPIADTMDALAASGMDRVTVMPLVLLGADLAEAVLARADEAGAGRAAANCDTCLYRVALPGFEERVGQPQTLHYHPDDPHTGHPGDPHTGHHHHHHDHPAGQAA